MFTWLTTTEPAKKRRNRGKRARISQTRLRERKGKKAIGSPKVPITHHWSRCQYKGGATESTPSRDDVNPCSDPLKLMRQHCSWGISKLTLRLVLQEVRELTRQMIEVVVDLAGLRQSARAAFELLDEPWDQLELGVTLWTLKLFVIMCKWVEVWVKTR